MKLPRISIVTPSFNGAKYLEKTILSVVNQDYPDYEYFIHDCGSTDGSRDIISKYAKKYPQIKPVFKPDKGQWDAVNKGFSSATGQILGFINTDDEYCEDAFKLVADSYKKNPQSLWFAGKGLVVDHKNQVIYPGVTLYKNLLLLINHKSLLLVVNYLMQPSVFITHKAFVLLKKFIGKGKYILEYEAWLRLAEIQMPKVIFPNLSKFRLASGSASLNRSNSLLASDYEIAAGYTQNKVILKIHQLHNLARLKITS